MKEVIEVFPDWCSSGLWYEDGNADPEGLGIDDLGIILALQYWHWFWEFNIGDSGAEDEDCKVSEYGIKQWEEDGQKIVDVLNEKYGDKYFFKLML